MKRLFGIGSMLLTDTYFKNLAALNILAGFKVVFLEEHKTLRLIRKGGVVMMKFV